MAVVAAGGHCCVVSSLLPPLAIVLCVIPSSTACHGLGQPRYRRLRCTACLKLDIAKCRSRLWTQVGKSGAVKAPPGRPGMSEPGHLGYACAKHDRRRRAIGWHGTAGHAGRLGCLTLPYLAVITLYLRKKRDIVFCEWRALGAADIDDASPPLRRPS
jgi:hypothetical protein